MAFHHVAIATRDVEATHQFYTDVMGFRLVKVNCTPTPEGGWSKHLFYDTGNGEMIAFWDIHGDGPKRDFDPAISTGLGLPTWANHIAFDAPTLDALHALRDRWVAKGCDVAEIDHHWCTSIYTMDPNGVMVEFCTSTAQFTQADHEEAARLLADPSPPLGEPGRISVFRAKK